MPFAIFCDFDGTLTDKDTIDLLVEHHLGVDYRRNVSRRLLSGQATIREILIEEFEQLTVTPEEIAAFLLARVQVDPHLNELIAYAAERDFPLMVLSSGMDLLIHPLLHAVGSRLPVRCNRLVCDRSGEQPRLRIEFRDDSENGHDKAAVLREARREGYEIIYLGDGLTDVACAREADVLFARRQLEDYCRREGIPYRPLHGCIDVLEYLRSQEASEPLLTSHR